MLKRTFTEKLLIPKFCVNIDLISPFENYLFIKNIYILKLSNIQHHDKNNIYMKYADQQLDCIKSYN